MVKLPAASAFWAWSTQVAEEMLAVGAVVSAAKVAVTAATVLLPARSVNAAALKVQISPAVTLAVTRPSSAVAGTATYLVAPPVVFAVIAVIVKGSLLPSHLAVTRLVRHKAQGSLRSTLLFSFSSRKDSLTP